MSVIEFTRLAKGGPRAAGPMSDLRVFPTVNTKDRRIGFGIRVSAEIMKKMRWLEGDFVTARFDNELMTWTIRRVTDSRIGNKLSSGGKKAASATVRFCMVSQDLGPICLTAGAEGYDCKLLSSEADCAVFEMC